MIPPAAPKAGPSRVSSQKPEVKPRDGQAGGSGKSLPVTVDSGIGGAFAAAGMKDLPPTNQALTHIGSIVCLPIGDKHRPQIISYTSQMISAALIDRGADDVIIACNTASTAHGEACDQLTDFILSEGKRDGNTSIYGGQPEKMTRVKQLRTLIQRNLIQKSILKNQTSQNVNREDRSVNYDVLRSMIHEIVTPTAEAAANKAVGHLKISGKDTYFIQVDSTVGTLKSGQYPNKIKTFIDNLMDKEGYTPTPDSFEEGEAEEKTHSTVQNSTFSYRNAAREEKHVLIQSRGLKKWVPAIEGPNLSNDGQKLANDALKDSQDSMGENLKDTFKTKPDLNMACCTHYPVMRQYLENLGNDDVPKDYLTQDAIVGEMARNMTNVSDQQADGPMSEQPRKIEVFLGRESISDEDKNKNEALVSAVAGDGVRAGIEKMDPIDYKTFLATHKGLEWDSARDKWNGTNQPKHILGLDMGKAKTLWKQDRTAARALERADARFIGGIPKSERAPDDIRARMNDIMERLEWRPSRQKFQTIMRLGRLGVQGEHRGIDVIALEHEPGVSLFNAAGRLASTIRGNTVVDDRDKNAVGIVTGFTVVDKDGNKVGGENDGPPGAVTMAKFILDQGTPVTIVCDEGSQSSVLSAAQASGLVTDMGQTNRAIEDARHRGFFANCRLRESLTVQVVSQDQSENNAVTPGIVKDRLEDANTTLLISIERPSPNEAEKMSSMAGADISTYNADLSELFPTDPETRPWATIGIGDGGNEIGTGNVAEKTKTARKPDFTPVVKNGDKIAAKAMTDETVLASVSNNGGVLLTVATAEILKDFDDPETGGDANKVSTDALDLAGDINTRKISANANMADSIVSLYKKTLESMYVEGTSIDGVTKRNARSVDGRNLLRPQSSDRPTLGTDEGTSIDGVTKRNARSVDGRNLLRPQSSDRPTLGTDKATHEDFFDEMLDILNLEKNSLKKFSDLQKNELRDEPQQRHIFE